MKNKLNKLAERVHQANINWWRDINTGEPIKRNKGELLGLVHSEISEAYEGIVMGGIMDDKLPHRKMEHVEIVDAFIRLLDYVGGFGYNIQKAYNQLLEHEEYNVCYGIMSLFYKSKGGILLHMHYKISRALEGERRGLMHKFFKDYTLAEMSIAETIYLIFKYAEDFEFDLMEIFEEKMEFNANRADHKHENRKKDGGKKF